MKLRIATASLLGAALMSASVQAEDIDLFSSGNTSAATAPNVLFIIDNTANWNTAFTAEMAALASTFDNMPANAFNIGLSLYTETGNPNSNTDGGYVRAAVRNMTTANKAKYKAMILAFDQTADKSNGGKASLQIMESYYYFKGKAPYAGNSKAKTDYTGNTCASCNGTAAQKAASAAVYALPGNAINSFTGTPYNSPYATGSCAKNFIIYLSNGPPQENASDLSTATSRLATEGGNTTTIPLSPSGSQTSVADEWARFMKTSSIGAKTYTIDVQPNNTQGQYAGWQAVLKSMANVSGGKYFFIDPATGAQAKIADALSQILSEIQSVNSVFASVSLPVSVNTQGSYLNQVYVGLFRPDALANPRWNGNLKQYKLKLIGTQLKLVDAAESPAINTSTGFITECARSYWTPSVVDTYWNFNPGGACIPPAGFAADAYAKSNFPDGNFVEKGGQAYMLRGAATPTVANPRTVKTCDPAFASCVTLTDFANSNAAITQAALGAASAAERTSLIDWGRGTDVKEENGPPLNTANVVQVRPSAHGDVIHSRPVAINFGTDAAPKIGVFYGDNDGVFRSINGNRTTAIGSVTAGSPLFEFIPPEFYGQIKRLYDNTLKVSIPGVPLPNGPKPYGMEGPVTAYDAGTERWIFATMRRGGRAFYSFVANASNPASVGIKWKKGCPNPNDNLNCSFGFDNIGQTWAAPTAFKAQGYNSGNSPLLIAGGGYDTCEDNDSNPTTACGATPKGNKVFVLDANLGSVQTSFTTLRSVIADTIIVPNSSGLAQYGYTADLGGNIYRITFGNGAVASWTMTKIASLGCATPSTCGNNRKFMFAPDVVEGDNGEYILLVGSGDREKPIEYYTGATGVTNYFFMLRDKPSDANWLTSENANCGGAVICLASLLNIPLDSTTNPSAAALAAKKGWYMSLHAKEQVVTSAITIFGTVNFSTQEPEPPPQPGSCSSGLGTTRLYKVGTDNGSSQNGTVTRYQTMPDVGLPPSPVAGLVTLDGQTTPVAFCIGCDATSPLEATQPQLPAFVTPNNPKARSYWYIEQ